MFNEHDDVSSSDPHHLHLVRSIFTILHRRVHLWPGSGVCSGAGSAQCGGVSAPLLWWCSLPRLHSLVSPLSDSLESVLEVPGVRWPAPVWAVCVRSEWRRLWPINNNSEHSEWSWVSSTDQWPGDWDDMLPWLCIRYESPLSYDQQVWWSGSAISDGSHCIWVCGQDTSLHTCAGGAWDTAPPPGCYCPPLPSDQGQQYLCVPPLLDTGEGVEGAYCIMTCAGAPTMEIQCEAGAWDTDIDNISCSWYKHSFCFVNVWFFLNVCLTDFFGFNMMNGEGELTTTIIINNITATTSPDSTTEGISRCRRLHSATRQQRRVSCGTHTNVYVSGELINSNQSLTTIQRTHTTKIKTTSTPSWSEGIEVKKLLL